uniref:Uncharacterized protein n=1 Tax=Arundo donax TaxID=35708 RepID=A0A0A9FSM9_ARUDO
MVVYDFACKLWLPATLSIGLLNHDKLIRCSFTDLALNGTKTVDMFMFYFV